MLYAGIDIHKAVFQAVVLNPDSGELSESRFACGVPKLCSHRGITRICGRN
jgi:hypothetical protein